MKTKIFCGSISQIPLTPGPLSKGEGEKRSSFSSLKIRKFKKKGAVPNGGIESCPTAFNIKNPHKWAFYMLSISFVNLV